MEIIRDKLVLIIGGTGSIGETLVSTLLENSFPKQIRIYSRDETKQFFLQKKLERYREKLRFFLGDIRDKERLNRAMQDVDIVFHLAALKHVVACEYNPFEAIKTNVLGIQNLIEVCIENNIEKVIFTSTDKAATPCNTMGVTKLLGEKLMTAANFYKGSSKTVFYSVRFGNVLGSRGSIIPLVEDQIKNEHPITLTHKDMTRYIMSINKAINLIIETLKIAQGGEVFVLKMDCIKIVDLLDVLINHFTKTYNKSSAKIQIKEIGLFSGEKMYEELFSIEESYRTFEIEDIFIIFPQITELFENIDLSKYKDIKKFDIKKAFNSKDAQFLSKEEILDFLMDSNVI